ncbi:MAG: hypothetical protein ACP5N3_00200 [Candidatus Nanoarchaeia archaeon]
MIQINFILLIFFFGIIYLCSSIVPALAPSEVKNTRKQILFLLKVTASATVFLVAANLSSNLVGAIIAIVTLLILFLMKDNQSAYYLLPALIGLSIISENYYILTCMTTTLFLKGMVDYTAIKKLKWKDKRISMFIYIIIATALVIILTKIINATVA